MKDYTTDNLLYLRKHYNSIYHVVRNKDRNDKQYVLSQSKSGAPTLSHSDQDQSARPFFYHSSYDPAHEASRWIRQMEAVIGDAKHVLVFGVGLAYQLEQLIQRYPDKRIYVYEPDLEVMLALMQARELKPILSHPNLITFGLGTEEGVMELFVHWFVRHVSDSYCILCLPAYEKKYGELLTKFMEALKQAALDERSNFATYFLFQDKWVMNILGNVNAMLNSRPISGLKNIFKGMPAVVVGSGPSLMDDLDHLKKIKKHAIIIAAGTSIQALLANDIKPHFSISMDGGEPNYEAFRDLDLDGIAFVFSPFVHEGIPRQANTKQFHYYHDTDMLTKYLFGAEQKTGFYSSSSVTGSAIQLAAFLGCPTILLTGQDLSFPDHMHYTKNVDHVSESVQEQIVKDADETVENVSGGTNPTSKKMLITLRDIEKLLRLFPDVQFINTSKRGAKISGTAFQPMEQLMEQFRHVQVDTAWLFQQLDEHAKSVDAVAIRSVYRKLTGLLEGMADFNDLLVPLAEQIADMSQNASRLETKITNVFDLWEKVTNHLVFQKLYALAVEGNIYALERKFTEIRLSTDLAEKSQYIQKYLGSIIHAMCVAAPHLEQKLAETVRVLAREHHLDMKY